MTPNYPNRRGFLLTAALVLAAMAALPVDVPVARAFKTWNTSETIHGCLAFFDMFEVFGHGMGVAVLLIVLHQLDPGRRWAIPRVIACTVAAGAFADLLKLFVLRIRPYECLLEGSVWTTFGCWFPIFQAGSPGQSFPSAHTATAVGFAAALTWLYPQGRLLFTVLAVLVGCQRIVCGAHYPSDVLIGAAAGCLVAPLILNLGRIPVWFSRWEERWRSASAASARPTPHDTADRGR
jgi:membrane-associated phospholipid phosphatase